MVFAFNDKNTQYITPDYPQCGYGESNPDLMLGKHSFYH